MNVLVVRQYVHDGQDLKIIMVARTNEINMISPVTTLKTMTANGNPYLVYGDECAKFTGKSKFDLTITVAECTSGNLERW